MDPFLCMIVPFGFSYAPVGWKFCDGSLLPQAQYQAVFALLGVTYGGDGRTTVGLPDLRSRSPIGYSNTQLSGRTAHTLGTTGGVESVGLTTAMTPLIPQYP